MNAVPKSSRLPTEPVPVLGPVISADPVPVTVAAIEIFASAVRASDTSCAPPTFVASATAVLQKKLFQDTDLDLDLNRTMHTDQQTTVHRPIIPGDVLRARCWVSAVREAGGGRMVTVRADVIDSSDLCVYETTSSLMSSLPKTVPRTQNHAGGKFT